MKSNTWTIIRKEFARFFGDRQLLFTTVIMPGLLIYLIYSLMGSGMGKIMTEGMNKDITLHVENLPPTLEPALATMEHVALATGSTPSDRDALKALIEDKEQDLVLICFPADFEAIIATYDPQEGIAAPNVEIYYNSANHASERVFNSLQTILTTYEDALSNRFDINRQDTDDQLYNLADTDDIFSDFLSKLLPMLIMMLLFSGVVAIAPTSIAGEKERGTIATLLVTPLRRSQLALGKVVSLSTIALLSGLSSFIGIVLSLPRMIRTEATDISDLPIGLSYTTSDYILLLVVIFATVLIMASAVSLLSALAKDTKNAGTMVTPLMLVVMLAGLIPMFQSEAPQNLGVYLIPFYNTIQLMVGIFNHDVQWTAAALTIGSDVAYTALAVWGLSRMFNSEKIMFSR